MLTQKEMVRELKVSDIHVDTYKAALCNLFVEDTKRGELKRVPTVIDLETPGRATENGRLLVYVVSETKGRKAIPCVDIDFNVEFKYEGIRSSIPEMIEYWINQTIRFNSDTIVTNDGMSIEDEMARMHYLDERAAALPVANETRRRLVEKYKGKLGRAWRKAIRLEKLSYGGTTYHEACRNHFMADWQAAMDVASLTGLA